MPTADRPDDDHLPTSWFFIGALIIALAGVGCFGLAAAVDGYAPLVIEGIVLLAIAAACLSAGIWVFVIATGVRNGRQR